MNNLSLDVCKWKTTKTTRNYDDGDDDRPLSINGCITFKWISCPVKSSKANEKKQQEINFKNKAHIYLWTEHCAQPHRNLLYINI